MPHAQLISANVEVKAVFSGSGFAVSGYRPTSISDPAILECKNEKVIAIRFNYQVQAHLNSLQALSFLNKLMINKKLIFPIDHLAC